MKAIADLPVAPNRLPWLGHSVAASRDPMGFLEQLRPLGSMVRFSIGPREAVLVLAPDLLHELLITKADHFVNGRLARLAEHLVGKSMLLLTGEEHSYRRHLFYPYLHRDALEPFAALAARTAEEHTSSWQDRTWIDVPRELLAIEFELMHEFVFGRRMPKDRETRFQELYDQTFRRLGPRTLIPHWAHRLPLPMNLRFHRACREILGIIEDEVEESLQAPPEQGAGFIKRAAEASAQAGRPLSARELSEEAMGYTSAVETSAAASAWLWYEMGRNPEVQEKARAEVDEVIGDRTPRPEDIRQLAYLRSALMETLRLYGLPLYGRECVRPCSIGDLHIPAGTQVFFSLFATQRSPMLYDRADEFLPERWQENARPPHKLAYAPFGAGSRRCPGDAVSMLKIPLIAAAILQRWRLSIDPSVRTRPALELVVRPSNLHMIVRKRRPQTPNRSTSGDERKLDGDDCQS